jgi:tetratricopeptide (TPR) repeat protein
MEHAAGNLGEAEKAYKKSLELRPTSQSTRVSLARVYLHQKRYQDCLAEFEKLPEDSPWRLFGKALVYPLIGRNKEAEAALQEYIRTRKDISTYQIAQIYAFHGDRENAIQWLERSYELRDQGLAEIKFNKLFNPIADDPRYNSFLKKMNLQ